MLFLLSCLSHSRMQMDQESPTVNLLSDRDEERTVRHQTYGLAALFVISVGISALLGAAASYRSLQRGTGMLDEIPRLPLIADIRRLVFGRPDPQDDERLKNGMNVLFLGMGGEGHDGALLTDTMMLVSVDYPHKRVNLLSIPRDLAYPLGRGRFEKINAVHAYAEQNDPGQGARRTADALSQLFETPVDRVVRVDFRGFEKLIDALGGIEVDVERAFTDAQYPTSDGKWMTVSFARGKQKMEGRRALIFARSRHGNNSEGSDFARSRRQQLILLAVQNKMLSLGTVSDAAKLASLYQIVADHVQTDLTPWELLRFAPFLEEFSADRVTMRVLSDGPDGELTAANVDGAFMLFPRKPDWSEIRDIARFPFATSTMFVAAPPASVVPSMKIEIKNGTTRTGFAAQAAAQLERQGYEILAFGNAAKRGYERSVIFDLTQGRYPQELARLRRFLDASISIGSVPTSTADGVRMPRIVYGDGLVAETVISPNTDFLVILGEVSYSKVFQK